MSPALNSATMRGPLSPRVVVDGRRVASGDGGGNKGLGVHHECGHSASGTGTCSRVWMNLIDKWLAADTRAPPPRR